MSEERVEAQPPNLGLSFAHAMRLGREQVLSPQKTSDAGSSPKKTKAKKGSS